MANDENTVEHKEKDNTKLPDWLTADLFENIVKSNVKGDAKIKHFKVSPAVATGENYSTVMLRVEIELELEDGTTTPLSYMLKIGHDNEMFRQMMQMNNYFDIEEFMYTQVVPEFEQLYRKAGVEIQFGAHFYKLPTEQDHVLLEDLRPRGFKNADRLAGLDMEHTKCALKKLAQWHAASAVHVAVKGNYPAKYSSGFLNDIQRAFMEQILKDSGKYLLQCAKDYQGHEVYINDMLKLQESGIDNFIAMSKVDETEFNVLNHGDCWANNIMFKHDDSGKVKETYMIDFQLPRYGTPAQDLYYFLLSSTNFDIKLKKFDYFIKFYHDNLIECLTLLKYSKKLPTLKEMHATLYKYGLWGYFTATGSMSGALLDPNTNATVQNYMSESAEGVNLKTLLYSNPRYRKHIEVILPWLQNRGAMELK